jgi:hypothetical protein
MPHALYNIINSSMHGTLAFLTLLFCTIPFYSVHAQTPAIQTTEAATAEQKSPSATESPRLIQPSTSGASASVTTITPLTIDQIRANLPSTPADKFEFLRRQRKVTLEALDEASTQLKTVTANISLQQKQLETLAGQEESFVGPTREELDREKKHSADELAKATQALDAAKTKTGVSQATLEQLQKDVDSKQGRVDRMADYESRFKEKQERKQAEADTAKRTTEELARQNALREKITQTQLSYQRLLGEIDDMVNQLFIANDAANKFKLQMSIAFAGLVALVIVGFFWISFSNDEVKKAIFSNETGIQFITMFAIVIAVILFGIIGILESKELSALLGGLSGYILGKSR